MKKTIKFNDFEVNSQTRELFHEGKKVAIQKKSFDLLLYLIEHRAQAVSKDELLEKLWNGRVVSESVLSHAATKLRTALDDNHGKGKIIRTVYGFGLQFVGEFEQQKIEKTISPTNKFKSNQITIYLFALIILAVLISVYFFNQQTVPRKKQLNSTEIHQNDPYEANLQKFKIQPKIAYVSLNSQTNKNQWQVQGLNVYLNQVLQLSGKVMSLPSSTKALKFYAINSVINTKQHNDSLNLSYLDKTFTVRVDNLPQAIRQINQWVCNEILINEKDCEAQLIPLGIENAYIIESYIRGRASLINGSIQDAIGFFTVCLQQDAQFYLARLAIAEAYFGLSDYKKAVSQAQVIVQTNKNIPLQNHAYKVIGKAYFRMGEFQLASQAFKNIIENTASSESIKAIALYEMAKISNETQNTDIAFDLAKQSKAIAIELDLPIIEARAYSIMGDLKLIQGELQLAHEYLLQALKIFEQLNYDLGMDYILSSLGQVVESQGKLKLSMAYAQQRKAIAEKIGDPIAIAGTHLHLANLLIKMGKLQDAEFHAQKMWNIVVDLDEPQALLAAYYVKAEIANAQNNPLLALEKYAQALRIAKDSGLKSNVVELLCSSGETAIKANKFEQASKLLKECEAKAKDNNNRMYQTVAKLYQSQLFAKQNQIPKSISLLNQAALSAQELNNEELLFEIYLSFFNHHIKKEVKKAQDYLNKTPNAFQKNYRYLKARAQVQFQLNHVTQALQLILEAKETALSNWQEEDEILLKEIQKKIQ